MLPVVRPDASDAIGSIPMVPSSRVTRQPDQVLLCWHRPSNTLVPLGINANSCPVCQSWLVRTAFEIEI